MKTKELLLLGVGAGALLYGLSTLGPRYRDISLGPGSRARVYDYGKDRYGIELHYEDVLMARALYENGELTVTYPEKGTEGLKDTLRGVLDLFFKEKNR